MAMKKQNKIVDMSTGELLEPIVALCHTMVKYISVDTINGQHDHYKDVGYRVTDKTLVVKSDKEQIFYNMDNVIRFYFELAEN